jgi:DNA repair protein RadC
MGSIRPTFQRRQRLRQCLIKAGAENLPDYELLQVMLFTATAGLSLPAIAGVKFVREVALRFMRAELHERPVVSSWDKLIEYCNAQIAYSKIEEFHALFLDRKNALIKDEMQQRGTIDHTPVLPPRGHQTCP